MSALVNIPYWIRVLVLYFIVSAVFTHPLLLNLNTSMWGVSGDNTIAIWQMWYRKQALINGSDPNHTNLVAYPFGQTITSNPFEIFSDLTYNLPFFALTMIFNELLAFNLISFFSFVLSGWVMYLFVYSLTKHKLGSFVAGAAFSLAPFHFWQSWTHISFGQLYWIPLYFWSLLSFLQKRSAKSSLFLTLTLIGTVYTNIYFLFLFVILTPLFVLVYLLLNFLLSRQNPLSKNLFKYGLVTILVSGLLSIPFALHIKALTSSDQPITSQIQRPINDLLALSLRPWDLLIPPRSHLLLGKYENLTYEWIRGLSNDFKTVSAYLPERVNYLGLITLSFSLVGLLWALKRGDRLVIGSFVILGLLAFLFSLPPFIYFKTLTIYFPTNFIYQFVSAIRVYARLGIIIMFVVCLIAAFGIKYLDQLLKVKKLKIIIFISLISLMFIDYYVPPEFNVTYLKNIPAHYQFLTDQQGAIIEYPWDFDVPTALLYQRSHKKPIFNMSSHHPYYDIWSYLKDPDNQITQKILKALGVRYLVLHTKGTPHLLDENWKERFYLQAPRLDLKKSFSSSEAIIYDLGEEVTDNLIVISPSDKKAFISKPTRWLLSQNNELMILNLSSVSYKASLKLEGAGENQLISDELNLGESKLFVPEGLKRFKVSSSNSVTEVQKTSLELIDSSNME